MSCWTYRFRFIADKSEVNRLTAEYMKKDPKLTEAEARKQAWMDIAIQTGWDVVGGVASGGIMGGSYSAINWGTNKLQQLAQDKVNAEQDALHKLADKMHGVGETENTAQMDGVKYSIKRTQNMSWDEQITGALSRSQNIARNDTLVLDDTPATLVNEGIESKKLAIPLSVITKAKSGKDASHSIQDANLKDLQRGVRNAPIVINNPSRNALVFVTDIQQDGAPVLVAFQKNAQFDGDDVHKATSIHLQMDVASMLKALPSDATIYARNESELGAAVGVADNLRSLAANVKFTGDTVTENMPGVNGENSSGEGQVVRNSDGAAVQIADVESASGGKLTVRLTDGSTADISELSFPNVGEQELWRVLAEYSDNAEAARQLLKEYRAGDLQAFEYAKGVEEGFIYGKLNIGAEEMSRRGSYVNLLNPMQKNMAYKYGQYAGEKQTKQRNTEASERNAKRERKGGVYYGYEGQTLDKSKLNKAQRVGVAFAERLARKKGITTYFYRSYVNEQGERVYKDREGNIVPANENGWYDPSDGSIHIDLNCGDMGSTVLCTIAHELTHFIQDWSADKYRTLCKILTEGYLEMGQSVDELVRNKQEEYRKRKIELSYEEAFDEVIASSMEGVLNDGRVMDLLDDVETKDMNLADRIRTFLEETAELIRDTIQAYRDVKPESPEGRIVQRMQGIHDQLQEVFTAGLHEGGENYRQGGKINTAQAGGVKNSIVALDNGNVYVQASRNVITGTTKAQKRQNITDFFSALLDGNNSMDIHTIEGDVLTITKKETATKARDDYKTVNGVSVPMTGDEFAVKLRAEAHIDEIAEVSRAPKNPKRTPDAKNHAFATNGFTYRRAYFEDFDGQYYEVTISVGHNGTVATVYNVGKIDKSTSPSAKIIAVVGSKPLGKVLSKASIRNHQKKVNKNSATNSPKSIRYEKNALAQEQLERENAAMGEDIAGLNELVAAMKRQGKDGSLETSTLDAAAATLMKKVNAKGKKAELMQLLDRFYQYVGRGQELTWEDIRKAARPAVNWLIDHITLDEQMSELEFAYNRELMEQELLYRVYGSYWNASTLYIVAGQHEAQIRQLKGKHKQRMNEVYQRHRDMEERQRQTYRQRQEAARHHYEEQYQKREAEFQESRRKAVERHDLAQVRQQIKKDVQHLDS